MCEELAFRCEDLVKSFGGVHAVDRVTLSFKPGQVTALIGPNGAGKSTLFHVVTGYLRPDSGAVYCNGQRIDGLAPWEIANKGVGRVFQDVRVFENMSVLDNVRVAFPSQKGEGLFGLLLHWGAVRRTEQEITRRAVEHLEFVGLGERTQVQGGQLSFGERKLLSLARLIATDAKVLLLDEPTSGVHPNMIPKILDLLRDFARDGRTLVVVEHDMSAIAEVADWAYCMDDGKLISSGPPDDVLKDPRVRAAYTGT